MAPRRSVLSQGRALFAVTHKNWLIFTRYPNWFPLSVGAPGIKAGSQVNLGGQPVGRVVGVARDLETRSRQEKQTQIFIETPYRNGACFEALRMMLDGTYDFTTPYMEHVVDDGG